MVWLRSRAVWPEIRDKAAARVGQDWACFLCGAQINQHIAFCDRIGRDETGVGRGVWCAFKTESTKAQGLGVVGDELAERGAQRLSDYFDLLEDRLQSSPYLASENFTFADITGFVFLDFARVIKVRIPKDNSATQAWYDKIKERPSAAL